MEETPFDLGFHVLLFQDSLALVNMLLTTVRLRGRLIDIWQDVTS